jgi:preprotein translocase subunit Sec63
LFSGLKSRPFATISQIETYLTIGNYAVKDYYAILGLPFDADLSAIRGAYKRLALRYHPDKNDQPDAAAHFIEVTRAYKVLVGNERSHRRSAQRRLAY